MVTDLTGKRPYKKKAHAKRKGHRKKPRGTTNPYRTVHPCKDPHGPGEQLMWRLIEEQSSDALASLSGYVAANLDRIDYSVYRQRGMQIGSGAMESLHRTASQMRLKLAGARWTPRMPSLCSTPGSCSWPTAGRRSGVRTTSQGSWRRPSTRRRQRRDRAMDHTRRCWW